MDLEVRVYGNVVVVTGAKFGFEADNAAAEHTGRNVDDFRNAARSEGWDAARQAWTFKYVLG